MVYRLKWRDDGTYLYKATFGHGSAVTVEWDTRGVAFNTTEHAAIRALAALWSPKDVVVTRGRK